MIAIWTSIVVSLSEQVVQLCYKLACKKISLRNYTNEDAFVLFHCSCDFLSELFLEMSKNYTRQTLADAVASNLDPNLLQISTTFQFVNHCEQSLNVTRKLGTAAFRSIH